MPVPIDRNEVAADNESKLLNLAKKNFGTLSQAEQKLFEAVANGGFAEYSADSEEDNDPADANKWDNERVIKATRIAWLCTDPQASALVTHQGIRVKGARTDGTLDLGFAKIPFPLYFEKSAFPEGIDLHNADICELYLGGTFTGSIRADGLTVEHNVSMDDGFKAEGEVSLLGAEIGGVLNCNNACFLNPADVALSADNMKVQGTVFLSNGFEARGRVRLVGARIGGNLECEGGHFVTETAAACFDGERILVEGHVFLRNEFTARGEVRLLGARIGRSLDCENSQFINPKAAALFADDIKVGDVFLRNGCKVEGEVHMIGATIDGTLDCHNSHFNNPKGVAFVAGGLKVRGSVFLSDGFEAEGGVRLLGATIGGNLECDKGKFINPKGCAFNAERADVSGHVFLRNYFKAEGQVVLASMRIGGSLDCSKGQFISQEGTTLEGESLEVEGSVFLGPDFEAKGKVSLYSATIGGFLYCDKSQFINPKGVAFNADGLKVEGSVFLRNGFKAEGEVHMINATIGGSLECDNGQFLNSGGTALNADGLKVERYVFLRNGFRANGEVNLHSTRIGRDLECDSGQFFNPKKTALNANGLKIEGSVFLGIGFKAEGEVWLSSATIGTNLACDLGKFINPEGRALNAERLKVEGSVFLRSGFKAEGRVSLAGATIGGQFVFTRVISPTEVTLDLRSARIGTLLDDQKSWSESGKLFLQGLVYDDIHDSAPMDAKTRIDWLRRQPSDNFRAQPYEQLATVLRKSGHDADAKKILIAKEKDRINLAKLSFFERLWRRFLGLTIGYGYRPWRAFWIGLVVVALGWLLFGVGFRADVMVPSNKEAYVSGDYGERRVSEDYPKFNALVYSLDMFVPLVNLHQASYWFPNANRDGELNISEKLRLSISGGLLRTYLWVHIVMGWVLTTLLVVGLTVLIRS